MISSLLKIITTASKKKFQRENNAKEIKAHLFSITEGVLFNKNMQGLLNYLRDYT